jgi:hypothetical protein
MENVLGVMYNDGHHTKRLIPTPVLREIFSASSPGLFGRSVVASEAKQSMEQQSKNGLLRRLRSSQ